VQITALEKPTMIVLMYGRQVSLPLSIAMFFQASSVGWKSTNGS
jgi:hypothetical protein